MTSRRFNTSPTVSPARTGGDDQPRAACLGNWWPYDVLTDLTAGPTFESARQEAKNICGGCPLFATCLSDNREEPWARAIMGLPRSAKIADANAAKSEAATRKWEAKRQARLADLRDLIALGVTREDMPARLGCTPKALEKWCGKYARDEWQQLLGEGDQRHGNQHRKTDLGTISTRRKKAAA